MVSGEFYTCLMSGVPHPDEPVSLTLLPPAEALKAARRLSSIHELALEGVTDDEWAAFEKALTDR